MIPKIGKIPLVDQVELFFDNPGGGGGGGADGGNKLNFPIGAKFHL